MYSEILESGERHKGQKTQKWSSVKISLNHANTADTDSKSFLYEKHLAKRVDDYKYFAKVQKRLDVNPSSDSCITLWKTAVSLIK